MVCSRCEVIWSAAGGAATTFQSLWGPDESKRTCLEGHARVPPAVARKCTTPCVSPRNTYCSVKRARANALDVATARKCFAVAPTDRRHSATDRKLNACRAASSPSAVRDFGIWVCSLVMAILLDLAPMRATLGKCVARLDRAQGHTGYVNAIDVMSLADKTGLGAR